MAAETPSTLLRDSASLTEAALSPPADVSLNFARHDGDRISAQGIGLSGLMGLAFAGLMAQRLAVTDSSRLLVLFVGCTAAPMALLSMVLNRTHFRASSGLNRKPGLVNWPRCAVKFVGMMGTLFMLAAGYSLFPEYAKSFYRPVWGAAQWLAFPALALMIPYMVWVDGRMAEPEDGYWHVGLVFLGRWRDANFSKIKAHALAWLVKGFFMPFMLAGVGAHLGALVKEGVNFSTFSYLYATAFNLILTIDVIFGSVGYLLTLRVLDSHIISTEPTWLGWMSAIMCYKPFSTFILATFLSYKGKTDWTDWLQSHPVLFITWGFAILTLHVIYVWSTCSFGCRFSNLTNRGIIVDGPYRYLKHPAYVSKNLAWWLIAVPFVAHATWSSALRACVCLALTNGIYAVRAWTEERHLHRDPAYCAYSDWMNRNGLFAGLRRAAAGFWRRST